MSDYMNGPLPLPVSLQKNPYTRVLWEDDLKDPVTGEVIEDGTIFWAEYVNNLEWGMWNAYELLAYLKRRLDRIAVNDELDDRVPGAVKFVDVFDGSPSRIELLTATTDVTVAATAGANQVINVADASKFSAFTYVTIFDGTNHESAYITAIGTGTITVQTLVNGYAKGAKIARSTVVVDTVKQTLNVGAHTAYNIDLVEVV